MLYGIPRLGVSKFPVRILKPVYSIPWSDDAENPAGLPNSEAGLDDGRENRRRQRRRATAPGLAIKFVRWRVRTVDVKDITPRSLQSRRRLLSAEHIVALRRASYQGLVKAVLGVQNDKGLRRQRNPLNYWRRQPDSNR